MRALNKYAGHLAWMATLIRATLSLSCRVAIPSPNDHHLCSQDICPFTVHDQFRSLFAAFRPICPISDAPVVTDDFLSFEEWKNIRISQTPNESTEETEISSDEGRASDGSVETHTATPSSPAMPREELMPTVRVPLTDRFNYASVDCSARIHSSHKSSTSPASILSSKRDKYMLSPCSTPHKFVIVELCDDIQIG